MHSRIFETIKMQIDKWKTQCTNKPFSQALINTANDIPKLTLNMITAMTFAETETTDEFSSIFQRGISALVRIRLLQFLPLSKYIPDFILKQKSIETCISFFEVWVRKIVNIVEKDPNNASTKNCIGHVLVKARNEDTNESFTFTEIKDNILVIYFNGHESFSAFLNYTMINIALNPEIQKKMQQEVDSVVGDNNYVSAENVDKLIYIQNVIKESLRLQPAPLFARYTTKDICLGKYLIPKNTNVQACIYLVHTDPKHWKDALKFDPDRWYNIDEAQVKKNGYYMPFSLGSRSCIGQKFVILESITILAMLVHNFNIIAPAGMKFIANYHASTPRPRDLQLLFTPRI